MTRSLSGCRLHVLAYYSYNPWNGTTAVLLHHVRTFLHEPRRRVQAAKEDLKEAKVETCREPFERAQAGNV